MPVAPFAGGAELMGAASDVTAHDKRVALRSAIAGGTLVLPGVTDAMGARLVEQTGFAAGYLTGAGLANATYGMPDIGLISLAEVAAHVDRVAASARIPLVVDADTGYGNALSVMRTAQMLERSGAAGIQLEDQEMPKRCGHFDHHSLIPGEHMAAKIVAARQALQDDETVIIARTDARSVHGIDEAISRAKVFVEAGADVLFVEAPRTVEELELVGRELAGTPLLVNVVEGGKTPQLSLPEYERLGFTVVLFANYLMRSMMLAGQEALAHLASAGETGSRVKRMATWQQRQELFNLPQFSEAEAWFDTLGEVDG